MSDTAHAVLGQTIVSVCYFEVGHEHVQVFPDVCDVCDYGIALETSSGATLKLVRLNWLTGTDSALYLGPGDVADDYDADVYGPFRAVDASREARWQPVLGRPVTAVSFFGIDWTDRRPIPPQQFDHHRRPYDMRIDVEGAESIYIYSGNYQPAYGFERNEWFSLVVARGETQRERLLQRTIR